MAARIKNYEKKRLQNKHFVSIMKTKKKECLNLIKSNKQEELKTSLGCLDSMLQKLACKGMIHRNKARRILSRLAKNRR